jgi:hypothetical protein
VLSLDGYADAAAALCALLTTCYGGDFFPSCNEHVASGLETASTQVRAAWLALFSEQGCLDSCTKAKGCLDELPICRPAGAICAQLEGCCGFLAAEGSCDAETGSCCVPDGLSCVAGEPCCTTCSSLTGTCGGAVCLTEGEKCATSEECCSKNCSEQGLCSFRCREQGEDCAQATDCCSGMCQDDKCACGGKGASCKVPEECCEKLCVEDQCGAPDNCQPVGGPCADEPCCEPLDCREVDQQCCTPHLSPCVSPDWCCGQACAANNCCAPLGGSCAKDEECCQGHCGDDDRCACNGQAVSCDDPTDCCAGLSCDFDGHCKACVAAGCHAVCTTGGPLSPLDNGSAICFGSNKPPAKCVSEICQQEPLCCCTAWSDYCAELGKEKNGDSSSACYLTCKLTNG